MCQRYSCQFDVWATQIKKTLKRPKKSRAKLLPTHGLIIWYGQLCGWISVPYVVRENVMFDWLQITQWMSIVYRQIKLTLYSIQTDLGKGSEKTYNICMFVCHWEGRGDLIKRFFLLKTMQNNSSHPNYICFAFGLNTYQAFSMTLKVLVLCPNF